jgi:hypothetical protein
MNISLSTQNCRGHFSGSPGGRAQTSASGYRDGLTAHPGSLARQLLALMSGLEEQWLHHLDTVDLVQEWDRAMTTIATGVASARPGPASATT